MKFNYIKFKNFLSYGDEINTIDLSEPGTTLITGVNEKDGGSNGSGKCVFKGTKIITKELGEIEIQDLVPGAKKGNLYFPESDLHVLSDNDSWQLVKYFWITDKEDLYEVETENGKRLVASGDHRVMTRSGWKKLKDLNESDELYTK